MRCQPLQKPNDNEARSAVGYDLTVRRVAFLAFLPLSTPAQCRRTLLCHRRKRKPSLPSQTALDSKTKARLLTRSSLALLPPLELNLASNDHLPSFPLLPLPFSLPLPQPLPPSVTRSLWAPQNTSTFVSRRRGNGEKTGGRKEGPAERELTFARPSSFLVIRLQSSLIPLVHTCLIARKNYISWLGWCSLGVAGGRGRAGGRG